MDKKSRATEEAGQGHMIVTVGFLGRHIEYFNKTEAMWLIYMYMTHITTITCKLPVQC